MTPAAWLALAAAIVLCATPSVAGPRVHELRGRRRLSGATNGARRGPAVQLNRALAPGLGVVAFVGLACVAWRYGPVLAVAAGALMGLAAVLGRDVLRARTAAAGRAELRRGMRVLVAELEAGALPASALTAAAEVAPRYSAVLQSAAQEALNGQDVAAVLSANDDTRAVGLAWALGQDIGAALAEVLARVADDLSATEDQHRTVAVALSGPRSSAALLAGLPVVGIGLGASMGARPLVFLTAPGAGQLVCCVGVLLDVVGVLWMRRILHAAQRP